MNKAAWGCVISGALLLAFAASGSGYAQAVTFSTINDAVPGKYFDSGSTAVDPANPNRLVIGFNSGLDPATFVYNTFRASTAAFYRTSAMDTISFVVEAPEGYYVSKITYTQTGSGSVARTGKASGGSQWVVDDTAMPLKMFGANPTLTGVADLTDRFKTVVPVSITTGLFVFSTPSLGSATLTVTKATVVVEVLPLP
jgi:hypothetical protein